MKTSSSYPSKAEENRDEKFNKLDTSTRYLRESGSKIKSNIDY